MIREEFIELIESIGFKLNYDIYEYKEYIIDVFKDFYYFYKDSEWNYYYYNDLTPLDNYFKKDMRSYKLKQLLR